MNTKVKILSVVWYKVFPAEFGGQKGIVNFNKALAKQFQLTCICGSNNTLFEQEGYKIINALPVTKLQFINPVVWLKIARVAATCNATHLIIEHPYHGIAAWMLKKKGLIIITHSHNIEYQRFKDLKKPYWPLLKLFEKWVYKMSDLVLFKTKEDADFAVREMRVLTPRTLQVGYGVEEKDLSDRATCRGEICRQHNISPAITILLFNGTLDYQPNARAVEDVYNKIVPELDKVQSYVYKIFITGRLEDGAFNKLNKLKSDKVIYAGKVDNVDAYFKAADVYINPVTTGGGVQTKTLEALSYHLNVVCMQSMLKGIDCNLARNKLFISTNNDWQHFATCIIEASKSSDTTPAVFFRQYSFDNYVLQIKHRLEKV